MIRVGRKKRIFEAIENQRPMEVENLPTQKLTTDNNLTGLPKLHRIAMKCLAYTTSHLPPDQRLERIENWREFLLGDEGLKVLADEYDKITKKEKELKDFETKLYDNFIELDENMFRALCMGDLIPGEMDLVSEPETAPLSASTPQREEQQKHKKVKLTPTANLLKMTTKITTPNRSTTPVSSMVPEIPAFIRALLQECAVNEMLPIGPNGTMVSRKALISINWSQSVANVTRKLLMELFDRETLASHTLSGKPSPAFLGCNKPLKQQLDEKKVKDLTHVLTSSLNMTEKEVRQAITTKCADENKMWRQRMQKMLALKTKENRIKN